MIFLLGHCSPGLPPMTQIQHEARAEMRITQFIIMSKIIYINPLRLSFLEPKCARGRHIVFLESIFQHSPQEIVQLSVNHNSYNIKGIQFMKAK